MVKIFFCSLFFFIQSYSLSAQNCIYDYVKLGDYQVGFMDTILFDLNHQYRAFDYAGPKPYFIQIWYPLIEKINKPDYRKFKDFFEEVKSASLSGVHTKLRQYYKEAIIKDCIEENLASGKVNNFGGFTYQDILDSIGENETRSISHRHIQHSQYPLIVYHHGSQSNSFENYAMAEYFASHGFVFVTANFHLPFENTVFGLKPFDKIVQGEEEESLKTVLKFAQSFTSSSSVFFIGHSFGAQMGFRTFDGDSSIKGMVSLETSIEFKSEDSVIKELWPEVYRKVSDTKVSYPFPIMLCAATGHQKPFTFFENLNAPAVLFAATKEEFEHDAYLSVFYSRLFLNESIIQSDKEILKDRLNLYVRHLNLVHEFLDGILKRKLMPMKDVKLIK